MSFNNTDWEDRLEHALLFFDKKQALELSMMLHEVEEQGFDLSPRVEKLWARLTLRIEAV